MNRLLLLFHFLLILSAIPASASSTESSDKGEESCQTWTWVESMSATKGWEINQGEAIVNITNNELKATLFYAGSKKEPGKDNINIYETIEAKIVRGNVTGRVTIWGTDVPNNPFKVSGFYTKKRYKYDGYMVVEENARFISKNELIGLTCKRKFR